jgi:hypothetical protein
MPLEGPGLGISVEAAYEIAGFTRGIEVDIKSLSDFAERLRYELTTNLEPAWKAIEKTLDKPHFGNSAELELDDKRGAYDMYLQGSKLFFRNVIEGIRQMADAAEQIGAKYARADQFAQVKADDVTQVLPQVTPAAPPTPAPAPRGSQQYAI